MLKRHRPTTPPTSLEPLPSASDFSDAEHEIYGATKRRRIVAPVLDGRERGFQKEKDDDLVDEEEESHVDTSATSTIADSNLDWIGQAGQYKHTNALLHQLHLEHQRRCQSLLSQTIDLVSRNNIDTPSFPEQLAKVAPLGTPKGFPDESGSSLPGVSSEHVNVEEESNQVRARYEEHNRLLGSLVRRRKQEQDLGPEHLRYSREKDSTETTPCHYP